MTEEACINRGQQLADHFEDILEMVNIGSGAQRQTESNPNPLRSGQKVRKTIEELGGEMPENLPVADSIKAIDKNKEPRLLKPKKKKNE